MRPIILLMVAVIAIVCCMLFVSARADEPAKPQPDTVLVKIQDEATKMKSHKDYVSGFCAGIRAANWEEAAQHGWSGIPEDALMPPTVAFPDKTSFDCKKGR